MLPTAQSFKHGARPWAASARADAAGVSSSGMDGERSLTVLVSFVDSVNTLDSVNTVFVSFVDSANTFDSVNTVFVSFVDSQAKDANKKPQPKIMPRQQHIQPKAMPRPAQAEAGPGFMSKAAAASRAKAGTAGTALGVQAEQGAAMEVQAVPEQVLKAALKAKPATPGQQTGAKAAGCGASLGVQAEGAAMGVQAARHVLQAALKAKPATPGQQTGAKAAGCPGAALGVQAEGASMGVQVARGQVLQAALKANPGHQTGAKAAGCPYMMGASLGVQAEGASMGVQAARGRCFNRL